MKNFSTVELIHQNHIFSKVNVILKKKFNFGNYFSNTCPRELRPHFGKGFSWSIGAIYWYPDHICMIPTRLRYHHSIILVSLETDITFPFLSMNTFVKAFSVRFFSFCHFLLKRVVKNNKGWQWNKWQSKNDVETKQQNSFFLPFLYQLRTEQIANALRSLSETNENFLKGRRGKIINKIYFLL